MYYAFQREVLVYEVINVAKREDPRSADHILHMVDKGYNQYFKYIIMPYTGKSLDYIKETVMKSEFAQAHYSDQIAVKTSLPLKNLHELGYIHRDVKPDNFVVGRSETTFIQLLLTTRYTQKNRVHRAIRYQLLALGSN
ncbi:hypothetical protein COOONC_23272 [Cooperia oncophora]